MHPTLLVALTSFIFIHIHSQSILRHPKYAHTHTHTLTQSHVSPVCNVLTHMHFYTHILSRVCPHECLHTHTHTYTQARLYLYSLITCFFLRTHTHVHNHTYMHMNTHCFVSVLRGLRWNPHGPHCTFTSPFYCMPSYLGLLVLIISPTLSLSLKAPRGFLSANKNVQILEHLCILHINLYRYNTDFY